MSLTPFPPWPPEHMIFQTLVCGTPDFRVSLEPAMSFI